MNQDFIDKLTLIEIKDRKVLMVRSKGKDKFYTPGGKREEGEDDTEALTREIKEELSIDIIPETLKYFGAYVDVAHGRDDGKKVRLSCYTGKYEGKPMASAEIEEVKWLDYSDKDLTAGPGRIMIQDLKEKNLID